MSDNDLIRRGDALECFMGYDRTGDIKDAIAALPAVTVRVKPLVWRDDFMRWSGNSFTSTAVGADRTYIIAASLDDPEAENFIAAKKAAAQADYEARILAALEPVAAPDPVALLRDVPRYEPDNPLDNAPSMKADPQGDWLREADVLAALEPVAAPDPAAIREAALREALKAIDHLPEYGSPDVNIGVSNAYSAIRALIQKGDDHDR